MQKLLFLLTFLGITFSAQAQLRYIPADSIIAWDNDAVNLRNTALQACPGLRPHHISAPLSQLKALKSDWEKFLQESNASPTPFTYAHRFTLAARLFTLTADAQYARDMERLIYGPLLEATLSPDLSAEKVTAAQSLLNAVGTMLATKGDTLYVNYYANSTSTIPHRDDNYQLDLITGMPFHQRVKFRFSRIELPQGVPSTIAIRLPQGDWNDTNFPIYCNGHETPYRVELGYALITNMWRTGYEIYFDLPQPLLEER